MGAGLVGNSPRHEVRGGRAHSPKAIPTTLRVGDCSTVYAIPHRKTLGYVSGWELGEEAGVAGSRG